MCTMVRPDTRAANSGVPRPSTASAALPSVTIKMTTSDRGEDRSCVRGYLGARRFQCPRLGQRPVPHQQRCLRPEQIWAIGRRMTPSPMKPTECIFMNIADEKQPAFSENEVNAPAIRENASKAGIIRARSSGSGSCGPGSAAPVWAPYQAHPSGRQRPPYTVHQREAAAARRRAPARPLPPGLSGVAGRRALGRPPRRGRAESPRRSLTRLAGRSGQSSVQWARECRCPLFTPLISLDSPRRIALVIAGARGRRAWQARP